MLILPSLSVDHPSNSELSITITNNQALEPNEYSEHGALVVKRLIQQRILRGRHEVVFLSVEVKSRAEKQVLMFSRCCI